MAAAHHRHSVDHERAERALQEHNLEVAQQHHSLKEQIYVMFEYPLSSPTAYWLNNFVFFCIIASTVTFVLETHPFFRVDPYPLWFWRCEVFFVVVFTIEFVLRFWSTKDTTWTFLTRPMNIIDLAAILPFYIDLLVKRGVLDIDLRVLRVLRLARIFRLFKIGKYSSEIQILVGAVTKSWEAIILLFFLLLAAMIFFGAVMVAIERGKWDPKMGCYVRRGEASCSPFESVPLAFYWGVTTMTTVGYGDVVPVTNTGKVVTCCAMLCGIFIIALPVAVLGEKFVDAYDHINDEMGTDSVVALADSKVDDIKAQLEDAIVEYDKLRAKCREQLPRLQQLGEASLVAMGRCRDERQAHSRIDTTFCLLEGAMEKAHADMRRYIEHHTAPKLLGTVPPSSEPSPAAPPV